MMYATNTAKNLIAQYCVEHSISDTDDIIEYVLKCYIAQWQLTPEVDLITFLRKQHNKLFPNHKIISLPSAFDKGFRR